jgi:ribonuclease HI
MRLIFFQYAIMVYFLKDKVMVFTDGASRGNPGESASGFAAYVGGNDVPELHVHYNGKATNNYAEYMAIILSLEWCRRNIKECNALEINLYSDSAVAINQINGVYKIRSENLIPLNTRVKALVENFRKVSFSNLPREDRRISLVDRALNRLLDRVQQKSSPP